MKALYTFITSETGVLVATTVSGFSFFSGEAFLAGDGGVASSLSLLADFTEFIAFFFFDGELWGAFLATFSSAVFWISSNISSIWDSTSSSTTVLTGSEAIGLKENIKNNYSRQNATNEIFVVTKLKSKFGTSVMRLGCKFKLFPAI